MKDTKEQLIKEKESIKAQKIRKVTKLRERGITLIALVVTIIILLILTGVTLNIALSDNGLLKKAREAVEKYEKAQEDEEEAIRQITTQMYSEYVGAIVTGYTPITNSCTIGTETSGVSATDKELYGNGNAVIAEDGNQEFRTDEDMQWRVWDFDGNTLRIIGESTNQALALKGVAGYNNGVWAIEEICKKCYSNEKDGVTVTSLKRSDIQKVSTYDYTQYKHGKDGYLEVTDNNVKDKDLIHFGESKSDYINETKKYPQMWYGNDKNWIYEYNKETEKATGGDEECTTWEKAGTGKIVEKDLTSGSDEIAFKESYYCHFYSEREFVNEKYYEMIFGQAVMDTGRM